MRTSGKFDVFQETKVMDAGRMMRAAHRRNASLPVKALETICAENVDSPPRRSWRKSAALQENIFQLVDGDKENCGSLLDNLNAIPIEPVGGILSEIEIDEDEDEVEVEYEPLIQYGFQAGNEYCMYQENQEVRFRVESLQERHGGSSMYNVILDTIVTSQ